MPVYHLLYYIRYRTHVLYAFSSIFGEPRTGRRDRQPLPIIRMPTSSCTPKVIQQTTPKCVDSVARRACCAISIFAMRRPRQHPQNVAQFTSGFCTLFVRHSYFCNHVATQIYEHRTHILSNPSHSPAAMRIIWQNNPPPALQTSEMLSNTSQIWFPNSLC